MFHWRGGYLTREVLAELLSCIETAAEEAGKQVSVCLNWPQAVFSVRFGDHGIRKREITMESAEKMETGEKLREEEKVTS